MDTAFFKSPLFQDREDAAEQLCYELRDYQGAKDLLVLAVPRGGVPVAHPIARYLNAPLGVVLSKKIGHPSNSEYAIGSVSLTTRTIDDKVQVPKDYLEEETERLRQDLREKEAQYFRGRKRPSVRGNRILLVDDGVATGNTLLAAVQLLRKEGAQKVIVAVPVSSPEAADRLKEEADEFVSLAIPPHFHAIGQFYSEFGQINDEEVKEMLQDPSLPQPS